MKNTHNWAMRAALGLCGLITACTVLGLCMDRPFLLRFPVAFAWIAAVLQLLAALGLNGDADAAGPAMLTALLDVMFACAALYSAGAFEVRMLAPLLIGLVSSVVLLLRCHARRWLGVLRALELLLSICCTVFLGLGLLALTVFPISERKMVCWADSPDGRYTAVVWEVDEGALGGNTVVEITDHVSGFDIGLGTFGRRPRRVHTGPWGEWADGPFCWEDADTLLFNDMRFDTGA